MPELNPTWTLSPEERSAFAYFVVKWAIDRSTGLARGVEVVSRDFWRGDETAEQAAVRARFTALADKAADKAKIICLYAISGPVAGWIRSDQELADVMDELRAGEGDSPLRERKSSLDIIRHWVSSAKMLVPQGLLNHLLCHRQGPTKHTIQLDERQASVLNAAARHADQAASSLITTGAPYYDEDAGTHVSHGEYDPVRAAASFALISLARSLIHQTFDGTRISLDNNSQHAVIQMLCAYRIDSLKRGEPFVADAVRSLVKVLEGLSDR